MDHGEVLYDAFKETYIQARKIYLVNILLLVFSIMIVLLVVRDTLMISSAQPKMKSFQLQIEDIDHHIELLQNSEFEVPKSFLNARIKYDSAKVGVSEWPNDLPARKLMKEKYEALLEEYSGSHDKVIERLTIDGEPGLELFASLRDAVEHSESMRKAFDNAKLQLNEQKAMFDDNKNKQLLELETKKQQVKDEMHSYMEEIKSIQQDKTRLPWLGLRINPNDLLPFIPIMLLVFFHILFDRYDEILTLIKAPKLSEFSRELKEYPLPIFLGRRNRYAVSTTLLILSLIPLLQILVTALIFRNKIELFTLGEKSWVWAGGFSAFACVLTMTYPMVVLYRHRERVFVH